MQIIFQALGNFKRVLVMIFAGVLLQACGEDAATCQAGAAEAHVATASVDEHHQAMLHVVGKTCAGVGANRMRVYFQGKSEDKAGIVAAHDNAHADGTIDITLTDVVATMPEMDHGTAAPAKLDDQHSNEFSVDFQMPGQWQVTVQFTPKDTTDVETAIFAFEVFD